MSKLCKTIWALLLIAALSGCTNTAENIHRKIHNRYYNMPSYIANCNITINSNKNTNTYNLRVTFDSEQQRYRLDYNNISVILGEANALIKKNNTVMSAPVENSHMIILLNTFFKSYYEAENSSMATGSGLTSGSTVLECDIVNPPKFAKSMKLTIDNKTVLPVEMSIYDSQNVEIIHIQYDDFEFVSKTDNSIFEFN